MALLIPGYWQDTFWPSSYWMNDYWPEALQIEKVDDRYIDVDSENRYIVIKSEDRIIDV